MRTLLSPKPFALLFVATAIFATQADAEVRIHPHLNNVTPDGVTYLSLAFEQSKRVAGFKSPVRKYAIGLDCEAKHAGHVVYADDMDLTSVANFDPIGTSCRICERSDCFHRSVPPIGKEIRVDHTRRNSVPFSVN